jgi:serine/threonine-protein kinase SRPK3
MSGSDAGSYVSSIEENNKGLRIEGPRDGLEKIYSYETGGHHPVHLGDIIHERYQIIHKLGSGSSANVWLCRDVVNDSLRYVALKIMMAGKSTEDCLELRVAKLIQLGWDKEAVAEHFCLPLNRFEIDGPNGLNHVIVYPVLGPRVSSLVSLRCSDQMLRNICLHTTQAIAALHAHGICHGSMYPSLHAYIHH